ncbi:MAG: choice-of-anchor V domain-containing protein [Flavipsychrobacter sp.]
MKRVIVFTSIALIGYLSLSSYTYGPAAQANLDLTGAAGGSANCNTGGCHANNSSSTQDTIYVIDKTTGMPVTQYTPGTVYTVRLSGTNSNTALTHFGFQLSAVKSDLSQAGTFAVTSSSTHIKTLSSRQIVEHNGAIAGTGNKYAVTMNWTAPVKGSGDVTFHGILNAVNYNGTNDYGDIPNPATPLTITENTSAAVADIFSDIAVNAYPNPASATLTVEVGNATGVYVITTYDLSGRKIMSQSSELTGANNKINISTASWDAGIYLLQIAKDGATHTLRIIRR